MKTKIIIAFFAILLITMASSPAPRYKERIKTFYSTNEAGLEHDMLKDLKELSEAGYETKAISAWCKGTCFGITVMQKQ